MVLQLLNGNKMDSRENIYIIIGASGGIGKYLTDKYLDLSYNVIGTYSSKEPQTKYNKIYHKLDLKNHVEFENFINHLNLSHKNIILLNCAGINYNSFAHKADLNKWKNVIDVNLVGVFNTIHYFLPFMRKNNFGRVINFSSIVGQIGTHGASAYAASKTGLWGMTKSLAVENANKGITINNLNLGYFNIGMIKDVPSAYKEIIKQKIPSGLFGDPVNIFNSVEMLINSDYINGTSIDINSGMY